MKRIENVTEDQAERIAAQVVTRRATRSIRIERDQKNGQSKFAVVVETFGAEEEGAVT